MCVLRWVEMILPCFKTEFCINSQSKGCWILNDEGVFYISDQLLSLCLLSFEFLNTASSKDLCLASIEEAFFTPLWSALVALFR